MSPIRSDALARMATGKDYPGRNLAEALVRPLAGPAAQRWAGNTVQRLMGFWVLWHAYGDQDRLVASGVMSRANAYRTRAEFRQLFGVDVADFQPEIAQVFAEQRRAREEAEAATPEQAAAAETSA